MNEIKMSLIRRAKETYSDIFPCTSKSSLDECFTHEGSRIFFWFNTPDKTTHMMINDQ